MSADFEGVGESAGQTASPLHTAVTDKNPLYEAGRYLFTLIAGVTVISAFGLAMVIIMLGVLFVAALRFVTRVPSELDRIGCDLNLYGYGISNMISIYPGKST